jgi:predicted HTH domain antitoxin
MREYEMKKVAEFHRKGLMSLREAATHAKVSLYDMMDYVQKEKIFPPAQSEEEIKQDLKDSQLIFNKLKLK